MPRLLLSPMHGLLDEVLRDILTRFGGLDGCVTEFIRVSNTLLPHRVYTRACPELLRGSRTTTGIPVVVQLLGSDPQCLADNAAHLVELAPAGIDLNFGCPAPTVNRHRGGAILLDEPELLNRIVTTVRHAVPLHMPFSAKMRLGVRDKSRALECARALCEGGITELTVHARTRDDGYHAPAEWEWIARIREALPVSVVANGDIFTADDARRCRDITGCNALMLGRGAVSDPFLARRIRADITPQAPLWPELLAHIHEFWEQVQMRVTPHHAPGRLKLWLRYLADAHPEARILRDRLRTLRSPEEVSQRLGEASEPR